MNSWFGLFFIFQPSTFHQWHSQHQAWYSPLWSSWKICLHFFESLCRTLRLTDLEGVEDLWNILVSGIMAVWVSTITAFSFDLSKNRLDQENKQKSISSHDRRKAAGNVHTVEGWSLLIGWKGSYTVPLSKPTQIGHERKPGLFWPPTKWEWKNGDCSLKEILRK